MNPVPTTRWLLLVLVLLLPAMAPAAAPAPPLLRDLHGDPLPNWARARMGTLRYRQGSPVSSVAYSPDGKRVASGGEQGTLYLWEARTGRELCCFTGHTKKIDHVLFSRDGKMLFSASSEDSTVRIWNIETGKQRHCLATPAVGVLVSRRLQLGLSRDGKTLVAAGWKDGTILRWDVDTAKQESKVQQKGDCSAVAISADGGTVVATSSLHDKGIAGVSVQLVEASTGKETGRLDGHRGAILAAAFSPDGKRLATAGLDNTVRIWRLDTHKEIGQLTLSNPQPPLLAFLPDGKRLVWKGAEVRVFAVPEGKETGHLAPAADTSFGCAAVSPDGKRVVLAGWRGMLAEWDLATGKQWSLPSLESSVKGVLVSRDGRSVYSAGMDNSIRIWDLATGKEKRRLGGHRSVTYGVLQSPDGKFLASGSMDEVMRLWEAATGKELAQLQGVRGGADFTPDSKGLLTTDVGGSLAWWDVPSGKRRTTVPGPAFAGSLLFSPDGRSLAVSGYGWTHDAFRLCNAHGERRHALGKQGEAVFALCFSPDSRTLVSLGHCPYKVHYTTNLETLDYVVVPTGKVCLRLWEVSTGLRRMQLDRFTDKARSIAMSPDGRTLAVATSKGEVILYDLLTDREWGLLRGHRAAVWTVEFSDDGQTLVSGSHDGTILVWDLRGRRKIEDRPIRLSTKDLDRTWAELPEEDALKAYQAIRALARTPQQSLPLLRQRLQPVPAAAQKRIDKLIIDLDAETFPEREKATRELEQLGEQVVTALRATLAGKPNLEVQRRIERILRRIEGEKPSTEQRTEARALEVLELIDTPAAKALLRKLASGAPRARLTEEAKAALARVQRREKMR
jgi:WD40 repeat protein